MTTPDPVSDETPQADPDGTPRVDQDSPPLIAPANRPRAILILVIGLAALVWFCSGMPFDDTPPHLSTPSPESTDTVPPDAPPTDKPSDDGEVRIVEKGYQPLVDVAGEPQVSWGAMVENTSEEMVAVVTLKLAILDGDGKSLNKEHGDYDLDPTVPVILPGQRVGIGDVVYMDSSGVAKVKLDVADVRWYPVDGQTGAFAELKVSKVKGSWVNQGQEVPYWGDDEIGAYADERGDLLLRFRVDSGYERIVERPGGCAIFRDDNGKIVGASPLEALNLRAEIPPGWSKQHLIVTDGPPENFDASATKVYVYPKGY
ncbi:hypothetical protein [Stackebrandtia nassauensis]|uniref:Uncharacterized protein n=1 Tax=Stackebrandtia nassauensis (strain DSM 44728 / CIP 108903 / NRRL B-16338 / NBRC 102104 / LLR-40K-21) TaxID=446470 RepID=D3Q093_STANL|nr:hypothetical protein [Stackebrandtia nassauensis]ADD45622.1 hypothetical protein Snas_5996 [Stackebrandtia nassauensis DSM 44728]